MVETSVIVSIYNEKKYYHKTIESILVQTYTDFESLIMYDVSTANTFQ